MSCNCTTLTKMKEEQNYAEEEKNIQYIFCAQRKGEMLHSSSVFKKIFSFPKIKLFIFVLVLG